MPGVEVINTTVGICLWLPDDIGRALFEEAHEKGVSGMGCRKR
jgi:hypothetical protein